MYPHKQHHDFNRPTGVRGLAAGVLKQALDDAIHGLDGRYADGYVNKTIPGLKHGHINEAADFLFNPDREEDRALWLGLVNLDEGEFQSLCMKTIKKERKGQ